MKHTRFLSFWTMAVTAASIVACSPDRPADPLRPTGGLVPTSLPGPVLVSRVGRGPVLLDESLSGEYIARAIAVSLADPAVREEVRSALASSAVREHKLHLGSFLQGRGGRVLAGAYARGAATETEFQAAFAKVRGLEFYMPVEAHRGQWQGGPDILVAIGLREESDPIAFNTKGERVVLRSSSPPSIPVLALVPIETNFGSQVSLNLAGRSESACSIGNGGSLQDAYDRCGVNPQVYGPSSRTAFAGTSPRKSSAALEAPARPQLSHLLAEDPAVIGLYATFIRVLDTGEPWIMGNPELELHVIGKRSGSNGRGVQYQCSGEHANGAGYQPGIRSQSYVYDQNDHFWEGSVLVLNPHQVDTLQTLEPEGYNVAIWEDDQASCEIRQEDSNTFRDALTATQAIARGIVAIRAEPQVLLKAAIFGQLASQLYDLYVGDDDYVGVMVFKDSTAYAGTNPGNTHMIYKGIEQNGRATLQIKTQNRSAAIFGETVIPLGELRLWTATVNGANGSVIYTWSVDGVLAQSGSSDSFSHSSTADFSIGLTVEDPYGVVGADWEAITVSSEQCPPDQMC